MRIDAFLTPVGQIKDTFFNSNTIVVMIDVLRASTTICAALSNGAKEVIPSETLDKAVSIYSSLSRVVRFLGGERNGLKPSGFDAGNSPLEYTSDRVKDKTIIYSTTNGTRTFQLAKQAKCRIVGGFVNISAVLDYINNTFLQGDTKDLSIIFLCAGNNNHLSYEDALCAGAYINALKKHHKEIDMSDSAHAAKNLYSLHSVDVQGFLATREHAVFLDKLGFSEDINIAFSFDRFPVVPVISGFSIKKAY